MANQIRIDLSLTGEPGATRGMKNFGDATEKTGDKVTGLGKDAGQLNKKIAETTAEIKKLTKAFDETGDMDLLKSIRKEQSNLRIFDKLAKSVAQQAVEVGSDAGQKIGESLTKSLMALRGPAIAAAVGIGALLAPAIGAAIAGAVVGGAGVGGIVGGIVAAAQDQQVQTAAKLVADHVGGAFLEAGGTFVQPLIESLNILDAAGTRLAANFAKVGTSLAPVLPTLTGGAAGFMDNMMSGIVKAMERAKPALRAISAELPKIGSAIGGFFDKLSEDPDRAVAGIVAVSQAIQGTIGVVGDLLAALGDIFEWSSRSGAALSETWETMFGWMPVAGTAIKNQGQNFRDQVAAIDAAKDASKDYVSSGVGPIVRAQEEVEKATKTATQAIEEQISAMDRMFHRVMDPRELASNYQAAIDDLTKSVQENGKSLDIRTEQGRANEKALQGQAEAIMAVIKDMYDRTGDITATNSAFDQMVETLRKQATQLGMNKQGVEEFIAALREAQRRWEIEVRAPGLLDALERARELDRLLGGSAAGARGRAAQRDGRYDDGYGGGRAGGGPMSAGKWYTVGENGVEVVAMHPGGGATVYNSKQTGAMMTGATGGAAVGRAAGNLSVAAGSGQGMDALIDFLMPHFLKRIRYDGGDVTVFGAAATAY